MKTAQASDWTTKPLPSKRAKIALERTFSLEEMRLIQKGLIPQEMEDKWFIYWKHDALHFHRSWTGVCIYVVKFLPEDDACTMFEAEANRDPEQYGETSDETDAKLISYLIDVLLLRRFSDFPREGDSPEEQAVMMWGFVGRAMLGQHPEDE